MRSSVDPGEVVQTTVAITNDDLPGGEAATGVLFAETLNGMTLLDQLDLDDINASPIAFDDSYSATTDVLFTAAIGVLANDTEPLGPEGLGLNAGTAVVDPGTGTPIGDPGLVVDTTQGGIPALMLRCCWAR